jgi:hypothetical protein
MYMYMFQSNKLQHTDELHRSPSAVRRVREKVMALEVVPVLNELSITPRRGMAE